MSELKITKGEMLTKIDADDFGVEYDGFEAVRWRYLGVSHNDPSVIVLKVSNEDCSEEIEANANLVSEVFNVANETGKTPRMLLEDRNELLAALKGLTEKIDTVILVEDDHPTSFLADPLRDALLVLEKLDGQS